MRRTISLLAVVVLVASATLLGATGAAGVPTIRRTLTLRVGDNCSPSGCTSFRARLVAHAYNHNVAEFCTGGYEVRLQRWQRDSNKWELIDRALAGHRGDAWFVLDSARGLYRAVVPRTGGYMFSCGRAVSPERRV